MKKIIILLLTLISPLYAKMYNSLLIRDYLQVGSLIFESDGSFTFLSVMGNAHIGGSLNVDGSLTVNGVPISGGGGSGGGVVGPSSSTTAGAVVLFSNTTGNAIEQSAAPVTIDPSTDDMSNVNNLTVTANVNLPTSATDYSQGVINLGGSFINAVGSNNTALGRAALANLGSSGGGGNVAIGLIAQNATATGNFNVGIGSSALTSNVSGDNNVAIGDGALGESMNNDNVGIGLDALGATLGAQNVAIGSGALDSVGTSTTITNNIALGYSAGFNLDNTGTNQNNIYIGSEGPASLGAENNTIRIGTAQTACFIVGIDGATSSGGTAVFVNSSGQLGTATSSFRYKKDITSMEHIIAQLIQLRAVRFRYKIHNETVPLEYGLIAEEVEKVMPDLVIYNDGKPETVKYHVLSAILLKAVQELAIKKSERQAVIEQLTQRIAVLEDTKQRNYRG